MIDLKLPLVTTRRAKRIGQGGGSGKGFHTSGRGQKGQKARGTMPLWFEGGNLPLVRRTPFIKGKSRFNSLTAEKIVVTLDQLNQFEDGATVDFASLAKVLKISAKKLEWANAKVLTSGTLKKALTVKITTSASAKKAIEKAGGKVA